jgi:peptidoglycan/LPS O-acetylase OafA/YrhL
MYKPQLLRIIGCIVGILRLFLASLVVLGHLGTNFFGLHQAVTAVIVFYLLAGHVVGLLWVKSPETEPMKRALWFYKDRILRILPLYLAVLIFSTILWACGAQSIFLSAPASPFGWFANLSVIPLNYYMFNGVDQFTLIPPAWSLGVELQFYLLIPLLLTAHWRAILFAGISFLIYIAAQLGILNADFYGYRLLAGVGCIFLLGVLLGRRELRAKGCVVGTWLCSAGYTIFLVMKGNPVAFNLDVSIGITIGIPLIVAFLRFPRSGMLGLVQQRAGEISYGLFLLHFPMLWLIQLAGYEGRFLTIIVIVTSCSLAWVLHLLVERPLWARLRPFI